LSGVSKQSVLGPVFFNVFINNRGSTIEFTLSKFADDNKLSNAVDTTQERDAIQRDLDRLEEWAHENLMKFNKAKCKMLHLDGGNTDMRTDWEKKEVIESIETYSGAVMNKKLDTSQQALPAASKATRRLACIRRVGSRERKGIVSRCSALVRPHAEYCAQAWGPQLRKDAEMLEKGSEEGMKMFRELEHLSCGDRLRELGFFSREKAPGKHHCSLLVLKGSL